MLAADIGVDPLNDTLATDLSLVIESNIAKVSPGQQISYEIQIENHGNFDVDALVEHLPVSDQFERISWKRQSGFSPPLNSVLLERRVGDGVFPHGDAIGDINGDGVDDLLFGNVARGHGTVVFGGTHFGSGFDILAPSEGFYQYAGGGDFNGDGYTDLLLGASFGEEYVRAYVFFGGVDVRTRSPIATSDLDGSNGFAINGPSGVGSFGVQSISNAGDINGDGFDDIVFGAPHTDVGARGMGAGEVYIVLGSAELGSSGTLNVSDLDGENGFILEGVGKFSGAGTNVAGAGDVNGDGFDDVIMGAPRAYAAGKSEVGKAYVMFGGNKLSDANAPRRSLSTLRDGRGFIISGSVSYDALGWGVNGAGDVNGDGFDDLLVSTPNWNRYLGRSDRAYVVFGSASIDHLAVDEVDGTNGVQLSPVSGILYRHEFGPGGDVDGDGTDDLIVSHRIWDSDSLTTTYFTHLLFGGDEFGANHEIDLLSDLDGFNGVQFDGVFNSAGDINNDGIADLTDTRRVYFGQRYQATGTGPISDLVNIPAGRTVTYTIDATMPDQFSNVVLLEATVTPTADAHDVDQSNNSTSHELQRSSRRRRGG